MFTATDKDYLDQLDEEVQPQSDEKSSRGRRKKFILHEDSRGRKRNKPRREPRRR